MLSTLIEKVADAPRESLFLAVVMVVVGGLLSAMYLVCDAQTSQARERRALLETQRLAVLDCLGSDPRASYASCRREAALRFDPQGAHAQTDSTMVAAAPLSHVTTLVPVAYAAR